MKIAVVGIGVISKLHILALQERKEEIVALCDTDLDKARSALLTYGLSCPVFEDYSRMLREIRPDSVHICTPHYLHADMIVEALSQQIHVLCEKPLCIQTEDIGRILQAEAASSATLGVCHQNRYNPANRYVKEYLQNRTVTGLHGSVVWCRTADYYRSADWRGKWETEGGGVMINQALHTLDLLQWFAGEPQAVSASVTSLSLGEVMEVEDTATARFEGEVPFTIFATVSSAVDHEVSIDIRTAEGDKLHLLPHVVLNRNELLFSEQSSPTLSKDCYGNSHQRLIADFYGCIRDGRPFPIDGTEGAKVVRMILGMYQSKGERIRL